MELRSGGPLGLLAVGLAVAATTAALAAAGPALQDEEETGPPQTQDTADGVLSTAVQATLWANTSEEFLPESSYVERHGEPRDPLHTLANGTDVSFTEPPASAEVWTREDRRSLPGTDDDVSAAPPHAELSDSGSAEGSFGEEFAAIEDAHVTPFGVHPSTVAVETDGTPARYVPPEGTVRAVADYRVELPEGEAEEFGPRVVGTTTRERIEYPRGRMESRVNETWLTHPEFTEAVRFTGEEANRTPTFPYEGLAADPGELRVHARVEVEYEQLVYTDVRTCEYVSDPDAVGRRLECSVDRGDDPANATIEDEHEVESPVFDQARDGVEPVVYEPRIQATLATYPDGDTGLLVYDPRPWASVRLDAAGETVVRSRWRFFTARIDEWTTLEYRDAATPDSDPRVERSHGVPVDVYAYPSRHEPYVAGGIDRPRVVDTEGRRLSTPALPEDVSVPVVEGATYRAVDAVALREDDLDPASVTVRGIVRHEPLSIAEFGTGEYPVRESSLDLEALDANETHTLVRVRLREGASGDPIDLSGSAPGGALGGSGDRPGHVAVEGVRVETGPDGTATAWIEGHGELSARYAPGSWLEVSPAYTGDTAGAYQRPEGIDVAWGYELVAYLLAFFGPIALAAWAGTKLATLVPGSGGERA